MSECLFCKIINKEIPAEIVYEDDQVLAFKDINPKAPTHILLIPKKHIDSLLNLAKADLAVISGLMKGISTIATQAGIAEDGFRLVVNQGDFAGQAVAHVHLHILGGRRLNWSPG